MFINRFLGYKYVFSQAANRELKKLDKNIAIKITNKLDDLISGKENLDVKVMVGTNPTEYRLRVGDYRVVFLEHKNEIIIFVVGVGHRKEVYKG